MLLSLDRNIVQVEIAPMLKAEMPNMACENKNLKLWICIFFSGYDYYYGYDYQIPGPPPCEPASTAHKKFHCKSDNVKDCVDISKLCDGTPDCRDGGSDEDDKYCKSNIEVRIRDKSHGGGNFHLPHSGLLEVKYKGVWGTVCDRGFTRNVADVFCHMLGFVFAEKEGKGWKSGGEVKYKPEEGPWPVWINNIKKDYGCTGFEGSITDCHGTENWYYDFSCDHPKDIYLTCDTRRLVRIYKKESATDDWWL